jgi:transcription elongation factor Elf1
MECNMKDIDADFECPNCKRKIKIKIKEMVPGRTKNCPSCGLVIRFSGDDGRRAQRALDDFEKNLKRLGAK